MISQLIGTNYNFRATGFLCSQLEWFVKWIGGIYEEVDV